MVPGDRGDKRVGETRVYLPFPEALPPHLITRVVYWIYIVTVLRNWEVYGIKLNRDVMVTYTLQAEYDIIGPGLTMRGKGGASSIA